MIDILKMPQFQAIAIFLTAYVFIVSEKINKTLVAVLGAGLLIAFRIVPAKDVIRHIDVNVIFLLIFMMIIVKVSEKSGLFEWIAVWAAQKIEAQPVKLMIALFFVTGLLSALLDNVTTILLITPITILITSQMSITPVPFLITQVLASNIAGTATLIGDPPNIMIGSAAQLSFMDFIINLTPIIIIQVIVITSFLFLFFRNRLQTTALNRARIMEMDKSKMIRDPVLLRRSLIIMILVITGFLLHGQLDLEASVIALIGAMILVIWTRLDPEELFEKLEWGTILFFIGLFIMVGGLVEVGVIKKISMALINISGNNINLLSQIFIWAAGLLSGIIDNIPLVATFIPVIKDMTGVLGNQQVEPLWWSLSLGSCLGGNLTAIGASANVIMISTAKKSDIKITFIDFLKYGIPVTLLTLLMSSIYVHFRYF